MLVTDHNFEEALCLMVAQRGQPIGLDTETNGLLWSKQDRVVGLSVWCPSFGFYFPIRHSDTSISQERYHALLRELEHHRCRLFNAKFDLHHLRRDGFTWPVSVDNAHLLSHLADENEPSFDLKGLAERYFGADSVEASKKLDLLLESKKMKKGELSKLNAHEVAEYAVADAMLAYRLTDFQWGRLKSWRIDGIGREIEDYERITFDMEERGLLLDMSVVEQLEARAAPALKVELETLHKHFGFALNPRSPKKVRAALGTPDSKDETLETCRHPMAAVIRRARKWATMQSNYCTPYREFVSPDGALRPNYNLAGTVSGRPSCTSPNLQGVAKSDEVYRVKDCFKAREGFTYISADYSQAELRLAAHYTQDRNMMHILAQGGDIHGATANQLGIDRDFAKRINFGITYGLGAPGLSKQLHISQKKAKELLAAWNKGFPRFKLTRALTVKEAMDAGYIRMWTGRVRRFGTARSPEHKAFSARIQGGVAEILRHAIHRLVRLHSDMHLLLQVYDQILFEVPTDKVMQYAAEIRSVMENFPFSVKLRVDLSAGPTWGQLKKI